MYKFCEVFENNIASPRYKRHKRTREKGIISVESGVRNPRVITREKKEKEKMINTPTENDYNGLLLLLLLLSLLLLSTPVLLLLLRNCNLLHTYYSTKTCFCVCVNDSFPEQLVRIVGWLKLCYSLETCNTIFFRNREFPRSV